MNTLSRAGMAAVPAAMTVPALVSAVGGALSRSAPAPRQVSLDYILERVRHSLVPFNAQDVYQVCTIAYNTDSLDLIEDGDFMRGLVDAFERSDQSLLSPFQTSMIADTLRKAGLNASPRAMTVPEEDAISPESLLAVLLSMSVTKTRDERILTEVVAQMQLILNEFSPSQLVNTVTELSKLSCTNTDFLAKVAKRALAEADSLSTLEVSSMTKALAHCRGVPFAVMRRCLGLAEERMGDFQSEDYLFILDGLLQVGPQYMSTFAKFVEAGLDSVENMDAKTLAQFLICFTSLNYYNREHVEIYADAVVDVATDLSEADLVQAFIALQRLCLLDEAMFGTMAGCLMRYAQFMQPRHIGPVVDVCGSVPHNSDPLMAVLLDRALECVRVFSPHQLAEFLDAIALYRPARDHALVPVFGRQATLRAEIMGPKPLAMATRGLAHLGYTDAAYYLLAAETGFRYGFKDWSMLEPILMGLCLSGEPCAPGVVRILSTHVAEKARSMSLPEIERANRYLTQLHCEDDYVYRVMAMRVLHFVKEVTPEMPEELHVLLQRGAIQQH